MNHSIHTYLAHQLSSLARRSCLEEPLSELKLRPVSWVQSPVPARRLRSHATFRTNAAIAVAMITRPEGSGTALGTGAPAHRRSAVA